MQVNTGSLFTVYLLGMNQIAKLDETVQIGRPELPTLSVDARGDCRRPRVRIGVDQSAEGGGGGVGAGMQAQRARGRGHVAGGGSGQPPGVRQVAHVGVQHGRVDAGGHLIT